MTVITHDLSCFTATCTSMDINADARSVVGYRCSRILSRINSDHLAGSPQSVVALFSRSATAEVTPGVEHAGTREGAAMLAGAAAAALRALGLVPDSADPLADVPTLAAAVSMAPAQGSTGSQVLDAVAIGVEVGLRLEAPLAEHLARKGWQPGAVAGRIGAAAAAARMLGLSTEQTVVALGVAATQVAGFRSASATAAGSLAFAKQAADGVEAALLAGAGFTAPADAIGGRRGLAAVAAGYPDLLPGAGEPWRGRWSAEMLPAANDPKWAGIAGDGSSWDLDAVGDVADVAVMGRNLLR